MFRALLWSVPVLVFVAGPLPATDDKPDSKDDGNGVSAVVVKVDAKSRTVVVRVKKLGGSEVEKKFTLGDDARVTDWAGKASDLDAVVAGDNIVFVEKNGNMVELRRSARKEGAFNVDRFLERFDKNNDGFIQREELPERLRHAFDQIDVNKDGKLSREELEQGAAYLQRQRRPADVINVLVEMSDIDESCQPELQYIYDVLHKIDRNNSGKIDAEGLKAMREQIIVDRVDELMKELDVNNDGKLSRDEARGRLKREFDKLDLNKDGFIDRDELLKAAHERAAEAAAAEKEKEPAPAPKNPTDR